MRVATTEEDEYLQQISKLQNDNYILLNEIMLCESQIKGYKEQRRKETTKFVTDICICIFLCLFAFICSIAGRLNMYAGAIALATCGVFIVVPFFIIYTIIVSIKYYAKISSHELAINLSKKFKVENIYTAEITNASSIIKYKNVIDENQRKINELSLEYDELKKKNDELFAEELKSGARKDDFNFEAYNNFIDISNEQIDYNKMRVELTSLTKKRKDLEDSLEKMMQNEEQCKKSVKLFLLLLIMLIVTMLLLLLVIRFDSDVMTNYYAIIFLNLAIIASVIIMPINLVNAIVNLPYLSDSKIAILIADKIGLDNTKHERKGMMEVLSAVNNRIKVLEEEMINIKSLMDEKKKD